MPRTITITRKDKILQQDAYIQLLEEFISDSELGRRTKKNGKRLSPGSIRGYVYLKKYLIEFSIKKNFPLKLYINNNLTMNQRIMANRYYAKFYKRFTDFMYDDKDCYDNYVGTLIKCIRSFHNYLNDERHIDVGSFHRSFYVAREEIPIITLSIDQLNYIIYDKEFDRQVKESGLEAVKDIFIFGCTVALRVSDLLELSKKNLFITTSGYYLRAKSKKTGTHTSMKLPEYAAKILQKYEHKGDKLLPAITPAMFNHRIKQLARLIPDNFEMIKVREKRGVQVVIYKDPIKKTHYQLSDHLSSHTMRRTAITTMLNLGMPEHMVRKISGHAPNSREFYRYVELSQAALDQETDKVFEKLRDL